MDNLDKVILNNKENQLEYISRSKKLIDAQYDLTIDEMKFTYTLSELLQSSINYLYRKSDGEHNIDEKWDNLPMGENLSTNPNIEIIRTNGILSDEKEIKMWNVGIKYSLFDLYSEFKKLGSEKGYVRRDKFRQTIEEVAKKGVYIINENTNKFTLTHWFTLSTNWDTDDFYKDITLKLTPEMAEYIIVKGSYCKIYLDNIKLINFKYALRIYEILLMELSKKADMLRKGFIKKGEENILKFDIYYFKQLLNVDDKIGYKNNNTFKTNIVIRSVDEINAFTNIFTTVSFIKRGKDIKEIEFIVEKEKKIIIDANDDIQDYVDKFLCFTSKIKVTKSCYKYIFNDFSDYDILTHYGYLITESVDYIIELIKLEKYEKNKSINAFMYREFKKKLIELINKNNIPKVINIDNNCQNIIQETVWYDEKSTVSEECSTEIAIDIVPNNEIADLLKVAPSTQNPINMLIKDFCNEAKLTETTYKAFIKDTICYIGNEGIEKNKLIVISPNKFTMDIINKRYKDIFNNVANAMELEDSMVIIN